MMYENEIYIHTDVSARIYNAGVEANYQGSIESPPVVEGYSVLNIDFAHTGEHEVVIYDPHHDSRARALWYEHDNKWEYYTCEEGEYYVAWSVDKLSYLINDANADAP